MYIYRAWRSEIGSLTSLDACNSGASSEVREPISLHQAVYVTLVKAEACVRTYARTHARARTHTHTHTHTHARTHAHTQQLKLTSQHHSKLMKLSSLGIVGGSAQGLEAVNRMQDKLSTKKRLFLPCED